MDKRFSRIRDLSLKELELFLLASKTLSFREVSRQAGLEPANLSKIMKKIEEKMGATLFRRSGTGVTLLPEALELVKTAEKICELADELEGCSVTEQKSPLFTIGAISFLTTYLIPPAVSKIRAKSKNPARFRLIEFTHNDLVSHGLKGAFEIAVHTNTLEWTHAWTTRQVGELQWKLFGRTKHPLGSSCREADVMKYPFIAPTDWSSLGYSLGNDFCPLDVKRRLRGDECATAETALELCRLSDQLTFVPTILAQAWCNMGMMEEIDVKDWPTVTKPIHLTVKSEVVPAALFKALSENFASQLAELLI